MGMNQDPSLPTIELPGDYYAFLRLKGFGWEDDNDRNRRWYLASKRIGKFEGQLNRRRREVFGPGRFHGAQSATVFLNNTFIRGGKLPPVNGRIEDKRRLSH